MALLRSLLVLLLFQAVGTVLQVVLHSPVPGPVLGMALLVVWLLVRKGALDQPLLQTSKALLAWLGLLFVPAGVGVITFLPLLRAAWLPVTLALVVSTLLSLVVTALVFDRLKRTA